MEIFFDAMENVAYLEKVNILAYSGAKKRQVAYRLTCRSLYDNNILYFASIYETREEAVKKLSTLSAGTFEEGVEYV